MFKVDLMNVKELHEVLTSGLDHVSWISSCNLSTDPIKKMHTSLSTPNKKNYKLETEIKTNAGFFDDLTLPENLEDKLSFDEVLSSTPKEVTGDYEDRRFKISISGPKSCITTNQKTNSLERFEQVLKEYAKLIEVTVNEFYEREGKEAPKATLTIGEKIPTTTIKSQGPLGDLFGPKVDGLEELETKIEVENPEISYSDIGGCQQGKEEMDRIYADIVNPEIALFLGRDPNQQKGYILLGESGNGKTLLVKALATKLKENLDGKVKFYSVNYSDMTSIFRGGEAKATAKIFELVKKNKEQGIKTLLFLDEIHLVGSRRKDGFGPKDEGLDTLLTNLDGMKQYKGLTVIGATYQPIELLDPALIREGRLSTRVSIEKPNQEERAEIFQIYLEKRTEIATTNGNENLFAEIDVEKLAKETADYNGSHIFGVIKQVTNSKEDEIRRKVGYEATREEIEKTFTPITTEEFLEVIKNYEKIERVDSSQIGFF